MINKNILVASLLVWSISLVFASGYNFEKTQGVYLDGKISGVYDINSHQCRFAKLPEIAQNKPIIPLKNLFDGN